MRYYIGACLFVLTACATVRPEVPKPLEISGERRPEVRPLPPHAKSEPLPQKFSGEEWVLPALPGSVVTKPGLLISEAYAARGILFRTRYDELRALYEEDRKVWSAHRTYYETRLQQADQRIRDLQPNWWDVNKDYVYLTAIGMLAAYSLTLLVMP